MATTTVNAAGSEAQLARDPRAEDRLDGPSIEAPTAESPSSASVEEIERQGQEVFLHQRVWDALEERPGLQRRRILAPLRRLTQSPIHDCPRIDLAPLSGYDQNVYRIRVGHMRALLEIDDRGIWVFALFDRETGYKRMRTLVDLELGRRKEIVGCPPLGSTVRQEVAA